MIKNENKRISVSFSTISYDEKPQHWYKVDYNKPIDVLIDEFIEYIKSGYCFINHFKSDTEFITQKDKKIENLLSASFISIDVDDYEINIHDFWDKIELKPSFIYSTFSNMLDKNNRYRLVYVFDDVIPNNSLYRKIALGIMEYIKKIFNFELKDKSCLNSSQQMAGNSKDNIIYYVSYNIFSLNDFDEYLKYSNSESIKKEKKEYIIKSELKFSDKEFMIDFWKCKSNIDLENIVTKYSDKYNAFNSTPLPIVDADIAYIRIPENYTEIKRYWVNERVELDSGKEVYIHKAVRIKKGKRSRILFYNAMLRKYMVPDISIEHLLYCLVYELVYYIWNHDNEINTNVLYKIAYNAYVNVKYKIKVEKDKRKYIVNPGYCSKYKVSKNVAKNIARKQIMYEKIAEIYDFNLSVNENIAYLHSCGISVCKSTIYKFLKQFSFSA
ncbi:hypothetical protein HMPREF1074_00355 [Bacteroides xylanisolvens CL03T12C04]|uniref:Uncharacterized protein n=1 Tax=Bacteroides xylanisolvens CL03T12C04 TaxID=997892 RepID=I9UYM3_9BACE|nr:hypothetical protein [Bacteroides xylanisolvens]EIY87966.1 hypothetical protein HMPREF1074_00355 [Bacteroides xylanisolvens CL03T12C04]MBT0706160.1 hypothetical protein [Bacteroides xylanisolvens CL03T12C04]